jgi:NAD(P)-dependent dehydrogenase (short-subunit alcohol dehydrogenase family)
MTGLFSMKGKTALVTGGSRGIGLMIAQGFVEAGARVYISSRKAGACEEAVEALSALGEAHALPADLSNMDEIERLAAAYREREPSLDVLVNNAGAVWGAPLDEFPEAGWDKIVDLDLKSPFFLTQKMLPALRASASADDPSRVINIASIEGMKPDMLEIYSYSAAKGGFIMLSRSLARHLAKEHITVNALAPGPFHTKMMAGTMDAFGEEIRDSVPLKRIGTPEDIAGAALLLASRAGAWLTGITIPVDGGLTGTT